MSRFHQKSMKSVNPRGSSTSLLDEQYSREVILTIWRFSMFYPFLQSSGAHHGLGQDVDRPESGDAFDAGEVPSRDGVFLGDFMQLYSNVQGEPGKTTLPELQRKCDLDFNLAATRYPSQLHSQVRPFAGFESSTFGRRAHACRPLRHRTRSSWRCSTSTRRRW